MQAFEHVDADQRTLFVFGKYSNRHIVVHADRGNCVKGKLRPWINLLAIKHEDTNADQVSRAQA